MNKLLLCIAVTVAVASGARVQKIRQGANSAVHSISEMSNVAFGDDSGLSSFRPTTGDKIPTAKGVERVRLTQVYSGLDVLGTMAEAEIKSDGEASGQVYGMVANGISEDIPDANACMHDIGKMIDIAISNEGFSPKDSRIESKDGQRYVYIDPDTQTASLIYRVEFFFADENDVSFPAYFIDACNERVMFSFNQIMNATIPGMNEKYFPEKRQAEDDACETDAPTQKPTTNAPTQKPSTAAPGACNPSATGVGGNPKRGRITYNQEGRCLAVEKAGNTCTMRNDFATVVDNKQTTDRSKATPVSFNCDSGYEDAVNEAFGIANDAMYFGDITGRLYVELYGVRALPYSPRLVVHYSSCYDNAFWNGVDMFFGDGCSAFYPLVNQDVVTHELGHGITSRNSNLQYTAQSGGINEAFSDISGEVAKVFNYGENDWRVGYDIFKGANRALRYFINPADDGRSIKHVDQYSNGMDVHYSSGVFNHAFYQLVENQGMNIYDAYQCFLTANLAIWGANTGFTEGGCGVMQGCYDNGFDHDSVLKAFATVGVDLTDCDFDALSTMIDIDDSREGIKVSATRNPIVKIDLGTQNKSTITAQISGDSNGETKISVSDDSGGKNVLMNGSNQIEISAEARYVYVKLSSNSDTDVTVTLNNGTPQ